MTLFLQCLGVIRETRCSNLLVWLFYNAGTRGMELIDVI